MRQILLFPILQLRKESLGDFPSQAVWLPSSCFYAVLPYTQYNNNKSQFTISESYQVKCSCPFLSSLLFRSEWHTPHRKFYVLILLFRIDIIKESTDTNLPFHVGQFQLSRCFSEGLHAFGFPQITRELKQIKWLAKINLLNIKFMSQKDKMRFVFNPSQCNKKVKDDTGK